MPFTARLIVPDAPFGSPFPIPDHWSPLPDDGSKSVAASLQGFPPAAGWDDAFGFLRGYAVLALLGFLLLGAFSFHCLGLHSRGRRSPLGPRLGPAAASLPASSTR
jgi:hypothetical protein